MPEWPEFRDEAERRARDAAATDAAVASANPSPGLAGLMRRAALASQKAGRPVSLDLVDGEETTRG